MCHILPTTHRCVVSSTAVQILLSQGQDRERLLLSPLSPPFILHLLGKVTFVLLRSDGVDANPLTTTSQDITILSWSSRLLFSQTDQ